VSQHPYIQFRLQSASNPQGSGPVHLLLTAHYELTPSAMQSPEQRWFFASSGALSGASVKRLEEAWGGAEDEAVRRDLTTLGQEPPSDTFEALAQPKQPLSVQLKQLSNQLYRDVGEPETTMELELDIGALSKPSDLAQSVDDLDSAPVEESKESDEPPTHLVICLAHDSRHSPPPVQDLRPIDSVTLFLEDDSPLVWPWVSWAREVGAQLVISEEGAVEALRELFELSARVMTRQLVTIRPTMEGKLHSVVSMNAPSTGRHPLSTSGLRVPLCPTGQRLAWLLSVEPKHQGDGARELLYFEVEGERHIVCDYPQELTDLESYHPAVCFAQQLAQRGRILEQIISSYLNSDLRRVVHGLDQWLKLSVSLEAPEVGEWVHGLKIKFLHLGRFEPQDFKRVIRHALHVPYRLSADGVWTPSPLT